MVSLRSRLKERRTPKKMGQTQDKFEASVARLKPISNPRARALYKEFKGYYRMYSTEAIELAYGNKSSLSKEGTEGSKSPISSPSSPTARGRNSIDFTVPEEDQRRMKQLLTVFYREFARQPNSSSSSSTPSIDSFSLNFSNRNSKFFSDRALDQAALNALVKLLEVHQSEGVIRGLSLRANSLSWRMVEPVISLLSEDCTSITDLDLSENPIGTPGLMTIASVLATNTQLRSLYLSSITLTDDAASSICIIIKNCKMLERLDLSENCLSTDTVLTILPVLKKNTTLMYLNMEGNEVKDKSMLDQLEEVIKRNVSEKELSGKGGVRNFKTRMRVYQKSLRGRPDLLSVHKPPDLAAVTDADPSKPAPIQHERNVAAPPPQIVSPRPITVKTRFRVGLAETQGSRADMQDVSVSLPQFRGKVDEEYYAVYDGHGGRQTSEYAGQHLHKLIGVKLDQGKSAETAITDSIQEINDDILPWNLYSGTTVLLCMILGDTRYVAGLGDSRGVLSVAGKAQRLTKDHKPNLPEETKRIKNLGGYVKDGRVQGMLAVSRAIGDGIFEPFISVEPCIHSSKIGKDDEFLILACDGLWDVVDDQTAVDIVSSCLDVNQAAQTLKDEALKRESTDNISVIVISFNK